MKSLTNFLLAAPVAFAIMMSTAYGNTIQDRHLSGFTGVSVTGSFDVYLKQGPTESVQVDAPHDVIDRILTDVTNGTLNVHDKNGFNWGSWNFGGKKIRVYVTIKDVNFINVSGSGDVEFKDGLTANTLRIHVSGSGDVKGSINVKTLDTNISGSGDITLAGRADNTTAGVSGSGGYTAKALVTLSTVIHVTGSGDATVNATDNLDARVSGSGDIHYTGTVKHLTKSKNGSGDIEKM